MSELGCFEADCCWPDCNCWERKKMDLNNNKRILASQIIVELFESKQRQQLEILKAQLEAALMQLR